MAEFRLHTLGCGSAKPTPRHNPACTVLDIRDRLFMIDCGEGAQKEFQRQRLKFNRLNHIFITHTHGDHILGLPGLLGTLALSGCDGEVTVHVFAEAIPLLKKMVSFFCGTLPYSLVFNPLQPEETIILDMKHLRVRTVPLRHRVPAVGFIFEEKEKARHLNREMADFHNLPLALRQRIKNGEDFTKEDGTIIPNHILTTPADPSFSYVHISDTAYIPELAEKIKGCTLLYHETTYLEQNIADAENRGHSTARQAAETALHAGAQALLTGHYSSRYRDESLFAEEAREVFPNVILNREGLEIDIPSLSDMFKARP